VPGFCRTVSVVSSSASRPGFLLLQHAIAGLSENFPPIRLETPPNAPVAARCMLQKSRRGLDWLGLPLIPPLISDLAGERDNSSGLLEFHPTQQRADLVEIHLPFPS
jgi:hypothetical protein